MKIKSLIATGAAVLVLGCGTATAPGEVGRVLLEIDYQNYAFKATNFGFYIDNNGDVYRWDRNGVPWELQDSTTIYPGDLSDKYLPIRTVISTVPKSDLTNISAQIAAAADGPFSTPKHQCADAGTLTYRAFKPETNPERLTVILLRQEGDIAQQNTSAAAQSLIAYIRSLKLLDEISGCDP